MYFLFSEKEMLARLGSNIIRRRKELDLSQQKLANKIKATPSALNQIEKGKRLPGLVLFVRLGQALEVSMEDLFMGQWYHEK